MTGPLKVSTTASQLCKLKQTGGKKHYKDFIVIGNRHIKQEEKEHNNILEHLLDDMTDQQNNMGDWSRVKLKWRGGAGSGLVVDGVAGQIQVFPMRKVFSSSPPAPALWEIGAWRDHGKDPKESALS